MSEKPDARQYGLERGKVYPASHAKGLLNPLRRLVQSPRRTTAALELTGNESVMEIGSGPGFFSSALVKALPRGHLVLADLQVDMVRLARQRLSASTGAHFVGADCMALPFAAGAFDTVFMATMLGEVPTPSRTLREIHRVLRPGGLLAIAETRRDSDFLAYAPLCQMVERACFSPLARRGPRWQYVARFRAS